jgi:hypothetical protein
MTRASILSRLDDIGPVRHTWKFVRRSPLHLLAVLLDCRPSRSSFPTLPGHLRMCGAATNAAGERKIGPTQECVELMYVDYHTDGRRQCLAPLGFTPRGVERKEYDDLSICAFCSPRGGRAQGVQTSPPDRAPSVTEGPTALVDSALNAALHYAAKHGDEDVRHAASCHLSDRYCTPEQSIALGQYLSGYTEGAKPWHTSAVRARSMTRQRVHSEAPDST